ncbi:glycosyltransferase family 4 protein [Paenalcaligenes sp. Me131]|uniref:glycosyltransferase family 4 protein n=1 Tax=Paenalcaligenes sp. Me131 TaxID=3392636 RepID=UPI003D2910F3
MSQSKSETIWYIHPYAGGPGVGRYDRPYHLAKHWKEKNVDSIILTPTFHHQASRKRSEGVEVIDGVKYHFIYSPEYKGNGLGRIINMFYFSIRLWWLNKKLERLYGKPDAVVFSSPHPYTYFSAKKIAKKYSSKLIFEVRDLWPLSLTELAGVRESHPLVVLTSYIEKQAYKHSDYVVSLLPLTKEYMVNKGMKESKWSYIPNGISVKNHLLVSEEDTSHTSLLQVKKWKEEGKRVIIYAGALGIPNNLSTLLKALPQLNQDSYGVIIIGGGVLEEKLKIESTGLGLSSNVKFFSQVEKKVISLLLEKCDIAYISLLEESIFRFGISPNKIFDYMYAGIPILSAINAGNDFITEASCGISTSPTDHKSLSEAITTLLMKSDAELKALGENGRNYVIDFHDYENLSNNYLKLIN